MKVTYARTGSLEADLPNKRILMHLVGARYQQRDEYEPHDLNRMRDGISVEEGTLPISLDELYEKEKRRASRSMLSLEQLMEQLNNDDPKMRSSSRTEINKRFSFPLACIVFALVGVPLGDHRASARDLLWFRRESRHRRLLFSLHHRRRHFARECEASPRASRLVPKSALSRGWDLDVPAAQPAVGFKRRGTGSESSGHW